MTVGELIEELRQLDPLAIVLVPRSHTGGEVSRCGQDTLIAWEHESEGVARRLLPKGVEPHNQHHWSMAAESHAVVLYTEDGFYEARSAIQRRAR